MGLSENEIKKFLEEKVFQYNQKSFIETDPISVPHRFTLKQDIEIAAIFASTLAWGNRKSIIKNSNRLMELLDNQPYDFILHHSKNDLRPIHHFKHRTFNGDDVIFFIDGLQSIYKKHTSLEVVFCAKNPIDGIMNFRNLMLKSPHSQRSEKHISNPSKGSASKRLNMFLRWMVRSDLNGVDFGIWNIFTPSQLLIPLDVHSGRVARELNLLSRKQNDLKAVLELTKSLQKFDKNDPTKYDFALFGLGIFEKF